MIAIIDYDAGNIKSVEKALEYLGAQAVVTRDHQTILDAEKVILPGVGCFGDAMGKIREYDLEKTIHKVVDKGTPFLGICLGQQLVFEESEESPGVKGLSLLEGKILRIPDGEGLKIPHIGWNSLHLMNQGKLFKGVSEGAYVYFVHSYYAKAKDISVVKAVTEYGVSIHAAVEKDNVYACQYHPEKSSEAGLLMLKNFIEL
ncbi:MAG: imidazole glycerol phosphate synthase subunit HisH [Clostridia bacterium]|nr:imidazole glycerol phosphate synthase subunit HisH [Clostridia bacterium]